MIAHYQVSPQKAVNRHGRVGHHTQATVPSRQSQAYQAAQKAVIVLCPRNLAIRQNPQTLSNRHYRRVQKVVNRQNRANRHLRNRLTQVSHRKVQSHQKVLRQNQAGQVLHQTHQSHQKVHIVRNRLYPHKVHRVL